MLRGTRIHETFEWYYEAVQDHGGFLDPRDHDDALPDDRQLWGDFVAPYLGHFLAWEVERWEYADSAMDYVPLGVEQEVWHNPVLGIDGEPEWMGLADAVLPQTGFHESDETEGVVIVDFKTGSVPKEAYRDDGIYTELEYYSYLFDDEYDVTGVAAYYPRENETLYQPSPNEILRERIRDCVAEMVNMTVAYEGDSTFATNEGPLCKWGQDSDEESGFYGICTQCTWGKPADNEEQFRVMIEENWDYDDIAEYLGCSKDAIFYWKQKLDL
jgi:hypothetical protein